MQTVKATALAAAALALSLLSPAPARAQLDSTLRSDIVATGFIHRPLPLRTDRSFEKRDPLKEVTGRRLLLDMEDISSWTHDGIGSISLGDRAKDGSHSLHLQAPSMPEKMLGWGLGRGTCMATHPVAHEDWREYDRLHFWVYPDCPGARTVYLNLYLENDGPGEEKVPDPYGREGYHEINLVEGRWNECFLELGVLSRSKVSAVKFAIEVFGRELTMADTLHFDVDNVVLEKLADPEPAEGWAPAGGRIIFSTTGYTPGAAKTAVVSIPGAKDFRVRRASDGAVAFSGRTKTAREATGTYTTADFSRLTEPGRYYIECAGVRTDPFFIHDDVWEDSAWRLLNFLFVERCGYPVPGRHGACHTDLHATYKGRTYPLCGGWHDAGDMSQQTLQSAEISYSLMQMAATARRKGHTDLYNRLAEEALWGLDYVLRGRLGDGYRAMTWGTNLWTDGALGTEDDSGRREIRVYNGAFENFLMAGIEAYCSPLVPDDPQMSAYLLKCAEEDFAFARERFDSLGWTELRQSGGGGHARMGSRSQYHAGMSWAASMLYRQTGDKRYADFASEAIQVVLQSQNTEPVGSGKYRIGGFFYRDTDKRSPVHYNHQSRDYAYAEALAALLETQPTHPDAPLWRRSLALYGQYLKAVAPYTAPYGMAPSGVYHKDEVSDPEFYVWQVGIRSGAEDAYAKMLQAGMKIDGEHYLRAFPVWFSFKGNTAVSLATGKAAAITARVLGDKELRDIAERQLGWVVGCNPFGVSLIYGEGSGYCMQYNALPGETVGEIPVGMQSRFNGDAPYWPQFNTATYKEVWGGTAVKWLMLVSEF